MELMEEEYVNRRDAVIGLSLLGGLTVLLVATIFYRIINPPPPRTVSLDGMQLAADPAARSAPLAMEPPAWPGPAPAPIDSAVAEAAFTSDTTAKVAPKASKPTFIAPAAR